MIVTGVDGCPGGWVAVTLEGDDWRFHLYPDASQLVRAEKKSKYILVDIPIGLASKALKSRSCDTMARRLLSPLRHASVFSPPGRRAVRAPSYREACRINKNDTGVQLSIQSYNLRKKIIEFDDLLLAKPRLRTKVLESHPEIAFTCLAGRPMREHKKKPGGYTERLGLLGRYLPSLGEMVKICRQRYPKSRVAPDDLLDALALAVMGREADGQLSTLPASPDIDEKGLPMQIVYFERQLKFTTGAKR